MLNWLRRHGGVLLLILGIVFVGIGLARGEHTLVLRKAIRICLECIGIG